MRMKFTIWYSRLDDSLKPSTREVGIDSSVEIIASSEAEAVKLGKKRIKGLGWLQLYKPRYTGITLPPENGNNSRLQTLP